MLKAGFFLGGETNRSQMQSLELAGVFLCGQISPSAFQQGTAQHGPSSAPALAPAAPSPPVGLCSGPWSCWAPPSRDGEGDGGFKRALRCKSGGERGQRGSAWDVAGIIQVEERWRSCWPGRTGGDASIRQGHQALALPRGAGEMVEQGLRLHRPAWDPVGEEMPGAAALLLLLFLLLLLLIPQLAPLPSWLLLVGMIPRPALPNRCCPSSPFTRRVCPGEQMLWGSAWCTLEVLLFRSF